MKILALLPWKFSTQVHQDGDSEFLSVNTWMLRTNSSSLRFLPDHAFSLSQPLIFLLLWLERAHLTTCMFAVYGESSLPQQERREKTKQNEQTQRLLWHSLQYRCPPSTFFLVILPRNSYHQRAVWLSSGSWPWEREENRKERKEKEPPPFPVTGWKLTFHFAVIQRFVLQKFGCIFFLRHNSPMWLVCWTNM